VSRRYAIAADLGLAAPDPADLRAIPPASPAAFAAGCICNPASCPDPRDGKWWVDAFCPLHGSRDPATNERRKDTL
jgi:hypothetical protein